MTTRREALAMFGLAPFAAGISGSAFATQTEPNAPGTHFVPDRELRLNLSDDLQRQNWLYAGQRYSQAGAIIVNEDEHLRIVLANDTNRTHYILLDGERIDIAANGSHTLDFVVDQLQPKTLSNPLTGASQTIKIRPTYQMHAMSAA